MSQRRNKTGHETKMDKTTPHGDGHCPKSFRAYSYGRREGVAGRESIGLVHPKPVSFSSQVEASGLSHSSNI
jgi:hypothetical protein